ncbi:MAG TPA: ribonucleotide reductase subunit alpha, partial [Burkholderiaceae bacterium]|nr:ribonucleotide reductase subunit alpha [Burkholderiaceae bacterium]
HAEAEAQRFQAGLGGALTPIMCVDKPQTELTDFPALVAESDKTGNQWDVVLIACLSGRRGAMPSAADAEPVLKTMIESVRSGGNLTRFVAFDRDGDPIRFY